MSDCVNSTENSCAQVTCDNFEPDSGANGASQHSAFHVFTNDMLLEIILAHNLMNNGYATKRYRANLSSFRLVSPVWKNAVTKIIERNKDPLFTVTLTAENSIRDGGLDPREKVMDTFVKFLENQQQHECYKGFALRVEEEVFRQETHEHLVNCLQKVGQYLLELTLDVPWEAGGFSGLLPNTVTLSNLQRLWINLSDNELDNLPDAEFQQISQDNCTFLLQSLLLHSYNLKELSVKGEIPFHFQFMNLPASLALLRLSFSRNPQILQSLVTNKLQNLKSLTLFHCLKKEPEIAQDLLYKIFQNFSGTLKILCLHEYSYYKGPPRISFNLRFPVMRNLQELTLRGIHSELETGMSSISSTFPKLNSLRLDCQTEEMLKKWTASTPVSKITKFGFGLRDEEQPQKDEDNNDVDGLSISVEIVKCVLLTFTNITSLTVSHSGADFQGIQHIFRNMPQLTKLAVFAVGSHSLGSSDHWDALFMGVPLEFVVGLKACSKRFWKSVKLENDRESSIRLLKNLEYLQLDAKCHEGLGSLISDLTFMYALSSMSQLRMVNLRGRFSASIKIVRQWRKQDRKIVYTPE